jgi:creatinine amidohydrolase
MSNAGRRHRLEGRMEQFRWEQNTAPALAGAIAEDPVVVLPVGSVEQHGRHVPVGCDALSAETVARRAAAAVAAPPRVLVLPTLWYGYSPHHMRFPGSLTLGSETYITLLCEIATAVLRNGVRRVVILNGHGGNIASVDVAAGRLGEAWHGKARIAGVTYWHLVAHRTAEFRDSVAGGMGHACEFETSFLLAVVPDQVRMDEAVTHYPKTPSPLVSTDLFGTSRARIYNDFRDLSPSGTLGDPSLASAEKGERIVAACVEEFAKFLRDFATWAMT